MIHQIESNYEERLFWKENLREKRCEEVEDDRRNKLD